MDIRDFLRIRADELKRTAAVHQGVSAELPLALGESLAPPQQLLDEAEFLEHLADQHVLRSSAVLASHHGPERLICRIDHQTVQPCDALRRAAWPFRDDPTFEIEWTPNSGLAG